MTVDEEMYRAILLGTADLVCGIAETVCIGVPSSEIGRSRHFRTVAGAQHLRTLLRLAAHDLKVATEKGEPDGDRGAVLEKEDDG